MRDKFQNGLTIIELMVAIGILVIIFGLTTINLSRLPSSTSQSSGYDLLISDIRSQQTSAMAGKGTKGVHFEATSYTLFNGTSFSSNDPGNFVVTLEPNLSFSVDLPVGVGSSIVFTKSSGDIANYDSLHDTIELRNSFTGEVKTLRLNKYGATY